MEHEVLQIASISMGIGITLGVTFAGVAYAIGQGFNLLKYFGLR